MTSLLDDVGEFFTFGLNGKCRRNQRNRLDKALRREKL